MVARKIDGLPHWLEEPAVAQREKLGEGLVISKQMSGMPEHPCVTVYYTKVGKTYDIAESLLEVVSESR